MFGLHVLYVVYNMTEQSLGFYDPRVPVKTVIFKVFFLARRVDFGEQVHTYRENVNFMRQVHYLTVKTRYFSILKYLEPKLVCRCSLAN